MSSPEALCGQSLEHITWTAILRILSCHAGGLLGAYPCGFGVNHRRHPISELVFESWGAKYCTRGGVVCSIGASKY